MNFQYDITTIYTDSQICIWFSSGCHGEPHPGEEPHGRKLRYSSQSRIDATRNFLTFVNTVAITYYQNHEALTDFLPICKSSRV